MIRVRRHQRQLGSGKTTTVRQHERSGSAARDAEPRDGWWDGSHEDAPAGDYPDGTSFFTVEDEVFAVHPDGTVHPVNQDEDPPPDDPADAAAYPPADAAGRKAAGWADPELSDEEWTQRMKDIGAEHGYEVKGGAGYVPPDSAFEWALNNPITPSSETYTPRRRDDPEPEVTAEGLYTPRIERGAHPSPAAECMRDDDDPQFTRETAEGTETLPVDPSVPRCAEDRGAWGGGQGPQTPRDFRKAKRAAQRRATRATTREESEAASAEWHRLDDAQRASGSPADDDERYRLRSAFVESHPDVTGLLRDEALDRDTTRADDAAQRMIAEHLDDEEQWQ